MARDPRAARAAAVAARAVGALSTGAMAISCAATVVMTLLITVEVIGRSFFRVSTMISDEMSGYLLVVLTFFGLADSLRSDSFIRVEFLYTHLSVRARRRLDAALLVVALAYTVLLTQYFWRFVAESFRFKSTSIYFTATPLWIPQALMALGASLLVLEILAAIAARLFRGHEVTP